MTVGKQYNGKTVVIGDWDCGLSGRANRLLDLGLGTRQDKFS